MKYILQKLGCFIYAGCACKILLLHLYTDYRKLDTGDHMLTTEYDAAQTAQLCWQ